MTKVCAKTNCFLYTESRTGFSTRSRTRSSTESDPETGTEFFFYLERLQRVFEKNWNYRSLDIDLKKFFFKIFLCASTWNDSKIPAKFSDLLFFAVAIKFFCRFFLYYHVGAHAKNFARARASTPLKNCLHIKKKHDLLNI